MITVLLLLLTHVFLVSGHLVLRNPTVSSIPEAPPTVNLDYATYEGVRNGTGVDVYYGIRYAAPPLGNLRFRAPQDPEHESEVQRSGTFGPVCVGVGQDIIATRDEDCLFVNVFTPSNATPDSRLPVWVYIQGGGYQTNANANYNGTEVVRQSGRNIIFVNFNYRVGLFGFLASEDIREDGNLNAGLLDQRKLLSWVQKYISKFGGDPNHVVIHGTSAGAGSVAYHLAAYGGRDDGLFVGAVAQSSFWPTSPTVSESDFQYRRVLNGTGCDASVRPLSCLRSLNVDSLLKVNTASPFPGASGNPLWYFLPVKDGDLIRDDKWNMFDQGRFIRVPLLVANDNNEGSSFAANASTSVEVATFFKNNYPKLGNTQLQEIITRYPLMTPLPKHAVWFPSASAAYGDATFICPGESLSNSKSMARYFSPENVWAYRCTIASASNVAAGLGTSHTFEMPAILGTHYRSSVADTWFDENAAAIPVTMHYYISFVRSLNPNTHRLAGAPIWESWGSRMGRRLMLQTNSTYMEVVPQNSTQACAMWDSLSGVMEV